MRKKRRGEALMALGVVLLLLGVYAVISPFSAAPHLRVYFNAADSNVSVLEAALEYQIPLSLAQPYTQNLTQGQRTISVYAVFENTTVLDYSLHQVGVGFDIIRTNSINASIPIGSNVTVLLRLLNSSTVISEASTAVIATPDYSWIVLGVLLILLGLWFVIGNIRSVLKGSHLRLKTPSVAKFLRIWLVSATTPFLVLFGFFFYFAIFVNAALFEPALAFLGLSLLLLSFAFIDLDRFLALSFACYHLFFFTGTVMILPMIQVKVPFSSVNAYEVGSFARYHWALHLERRHPTI